ncbi:MAG: ABC transporter substrate-binding protein [Clostridiaceae bacterium]|nr:ABC transporter substrate-binding protein [Clostridiaceae bacterium]
MKKALIFLLTVLTVFTLFAGCAGKDGTSDVNTKPGSTNDTQQHDAESDQPGKLSELTKVTVSEFRGISWAPMYIAYQLGYYKDVNLDVELLKIDDGPNCFRGMHAGESDFCILSQEVALKAQEQGMRSTFITTMLDTRYYAFAATSDIKSVADLKGKTVFASTPGSAPYTFCVAVMEEAGLKIGEDVTLVTMDKGAVVAALSKGEVQAAFINADNFKEADNVEGLHYLVDTRKAEDASNYLNSDTFPAEVILCTEKFKNDNPEVVQAFVNATCRGLTWLQENKSEDAANTIADLFSGMKKEVIAEKIDIMKGAFSKTGYISQEGEAAVLDFSMRAGIITKEIPYADIVDMSFVKNAMDAGLVPQNK